ncbi:hypothetical protein [Methylomicrobium agile]|uniref:hypothetical protein n=1 Tax=Methylomicrobium agile TaxID=39774 RepID=UPI0004DFA8F2|nr:hypothetical protein [Methylomicrobium agile]
MSLKTRLEKLEQQQPASTPKKWELIGVLNGETEAQAIKRWKANNPDKTEPENIIFLVPFGYERSEAA